MYCTFTMFLIMYDQNEDYKQTAGQQYPMDQDG